jgi:hypothetical protein
MGFSSAHVQLDIAKTKNNICFQKSDFETWKPLHLNTLTLNLRTLLAWSVGKTRLQIHHYHGLFLNVTGHSWSPASFATAPVPDNFFCTSTLWVSESQILMGNPQVTMGFNTKMVIHDLDDLGYHFRKLLHVYFMVIQDSISNHNGPPRKEQIIKTPTTSYNILQVARLWPLRLLRLSSFRFLYPVQLSEVRDSQYLWARFTSNETYLKHGSITWNYQKNLYTLQSI